MNDDGKYKNLKNRVRELFPAESAEKQQHITNVITNAIRSVKQDVWAVHLSIRPIASPFQYSTDQSITVDGTTVYIYIQVD